MGEATACARSVVTALIDQGVREVVLSPGSRSAPLAYALHAADQAGRVRLHVRIDERTAGFLAIGLVRGSGAPVAVVTTSGTAVGHLHPAVLEAWHAHLPLVVISADRPRALTHTGANQTTQQRGLFDPHLRGSAGISDAEADPRSWLFEVTRLMTAATGVRSRLPGPVHLDVEFSDPLTPPPGSWTPAPTRSTRVEPAGGASVPTTLAPGPATVVVAGDLPPAAGRQLAAEVSQAGLPLLAEPSSNARTGSALATPALLLASPLAASVERVIMVGRPTLARSVQRLLARPEVELVVVSPYADWIDPGLNAGRVVDAVEWPVGDPGWRQAWSDADRSLTRRLSDLLEGWGGLTGPGLAAALWPQLGAGDLLFVGASNPVRDLALAPVGAEAPAVYANRGLSGIDGAFSTAAGIALAHRRPATALIGDVTAVHDLTGLVIGPGEPRPDLRVVIANDDGGSIFATLEHGAPEHHDSYERIFGTPHGVDFGALARGVGADHLQVTDSAEVADVLRSPVSGLQIVEAIIDRVGRRALNAAISALV